VFCAPDHPIKTSTTSAGRIGCTSELDYTEQTSWRLFLKYLDALGHDKATEAALDRKKHTHILDKPFRRQSWAAPKDASGNFDHNAALAGDDLIRFVTTQLFPYHTETLQ
jgi:type I restriction enzyme M protein